MQKMKLPRYEAGVTDRFHLGWFLERALAVLGYLHEHEVVHGNIEPGNLLFIPAERQILHRVVLVDFCFSIKKAAARAHIGVVTEPYSAPEVHTRSRPHPSMDVYALGMCAMYFAGGDVKTKAVPDDIDPRLRRVIIDMTEPDWERRPSDANELALRVLNIRRKIWGKPGLVEMPL